MGASQARVLSRIWGIRERGFLRMRAARILTSLPGRRVLRSLGEGGSLGEGRCLSAERSRATVTSQPLEVKSRGGCQVGRRSFSPEHDPEIEVLRGASGANLQHRKQLPKRPATHAFSAARDCRPPGGVTRIMRRGRSPASRLPTTGAGFLGICPFCAAVIARERASYNSRRTSRVEINKHTRRLSPRSPWCQRSGYRGRNSDRSCRRQDGPRPRRSYP